MKHGLFTRNFTLLLLGQISSLVGNYTLKFALSMYILERTGSAAIFAGILSIAMVPTLLLSPLGGVLADRANRRNIMVALDGLSGLAVLAAAALLTRERGLQVIGALLVALSILGAFESPTVLACVPQMQTGENLLRGNALVNQVNAIAGLTTPFLGSVFYTAFGIRSVMSAAALCFFLTALMECFIRLPHQGFTVKRRAVEVVREDIRAGVHFLLKEQPAILHLLLLAAGISFFVVGTAAVGFPFMVRNVLGLSASHYGLAESAMGAAAVLGGLSASLLANRIRTERLHVLLLALGLCYLPAGISFLLPGGPPVQYVWLVLSFCGGQVASSIFSIFALSAIQARTPPELTGKVMACVSALTLCAQPLGQGIYGVLFDAAGGAAHLVLLPTGVVLCAIACRASGLFRRMRP